jgi:hypothetical protein
VAANLRPVKPFLAALPLVCALTLVSPLPASAAPQNLTVDNTGDPADGDCSVPGKCSVRAAVAAADQSTHVGSTIHIPAGTYTLTLASATTIGHGSLELIQATTIIGAGSSSTKIQTGTQDTGGPWADRVFRLRGIGTFTASISGLTITGGNPPGSGTTGGGMENDSANLSLNDIVLTNNHSDGDGAGLFNRQVVSFTSGAVTQNVSASGNGGGIAEEPPSGVTDSYSGLTVDSNQAKTGVGGGIFATDGHNTPTRTATFSDLVVSNNLAGLTGGGIDSDFGKAVPTYTNLAIFGNTGSEGGGFYLNFGGAIITNATITQNTSTSGGGGGIGVGDNPNLKAINLTVNGNAAQGNTAGGGIFVEDTSDTVSLKNSIFSGNSPDNCKQGVSSIPTFTSGGHNLTDDNGVACKFTAPGDQTNKNPNLGPLQNNGGPTPTEALPAGSPAIDMADNNGCPTTDQRHVVRITGTDPTCDVGAFEFRPAASQAPATPTPPGSSVVTPQASPAAGAGLPSTGTSPSLHPLQAIILMAAMVGLVAAAVFAARKYLRAG